MAMKTGEWSMKSEELDLKNIILNKLDVLLLQKKKLLKVDVIYFDIPVNGIVRSVFSTCQFHDMKGYVLYGMIKSLKNNEIHGFIKYDGKSCKIRPKKK